MAISILEKYKSIRKEKLSDSARDILDKMVQATNNFKDYTATKKIRPKFEAFYDKIKTSKPDAIKGHEVPKVSVKKDEPKKKRINRFKDAFKRRKSQGGVPKVMEDVKIDAKRPAISIKGKRISKNGNIYYEYRDNRYDARPKKYPKLEDGGMMAKGGELGNFRFKKGDVVYAFQHASDKNGKLRKNINPKYVVGDEKQHNLQKWAKVEIVEQWSDEKYWETYKAKLIDGDYDGFDGKVKKGEVFVVNQGQLSKSNKRPISIDYMEEIIKAEKEDGYMAHGGMMAKGGHLGEPNKHDEGENINVFGYETKNFNTCSKAVIEFKSAIEKLNHENVTDTEKQSLLKVAENVDAILEMKKLVEEANISSENILQDAVVKSMNAAIYNYRSGMNVNLFLFVPQCITEIAKKLNTKFADGGYMADVGSIEEGNKEMIMNNIHSIKHHAEEIENILHTDVEIEAWVNAKAERAATDLSDITHYLDGLHHEEHEKHEEMADGGMMAKGGLTVGTNVHITDPKSMFKGKTGFISEDMGRDYLVTILVDGNERNVLVSKKGIEVIEETEYEPGGYMDNKIKLSDVVEGAKFKNKDGIVFIVDKVTKDEIFKPSGISVSSSLEDGKKGNYRNELNDFVEFLNEQESIKINSNNIDINHMAKGGKTKNWIQGAIKHKGALRTKAKKEGLIHGDDKLSMADLKKLEKEGGKTGKRAHLAETLKRIRSKNAGK